MAAGFKIAGVKEARAKLARIARRFPEKTKRALVMFGEKVMTRSKDEFVPVRDGILKNSGHVRPHKGKKIGIDLVYGGPAESYALVQHENMEFQHKVGGPKYLERPLLEALPTFEEDMVKSIKAEDE